MASPTSPAAQKSLEMPIEALTRVYWAVASTSRAPESEWQTLAASRVSAECVACGIKVTGNELRQLAPTYTSEAQDNPKLERLRLNFCARNTCQSRFYRVNVQPDSELHWTGIKDQLLHTTPEVRETRPPRARLFSSNIPALSSLRPLHLIIITSLGIVLFFLVRHWIYGSRIPVIQKKHEYRVIQSNE